MSVRRSVLGERARGRVQRALATELQFWWIARSPYYSVGRKLRVR
jgi:hypothetical protein